MGVAAEMREAKGSGRTICVSCRLEPDSPCPVFDAGGSRGEVLSRPDRRNQHREGQ